jgi:hypothetical protein
MMVRVLERTKKGKNRSEAESLVFVRCYAEVFMDPKIGVRTVFLVKDRYKIRFFGKLSKLADW